jgi:hypothetical protein
LSWYTQTVAANTAKLVTNMSQNKLKATQTSSMKSLFIGSTQNWGSYDLIFSRPRWRQKGT